MTPCIWKHTSYTSSSTCHSISGAAQSQGSITVVEDVADRCPARRRPPASLHEVGGICSLADMCTMLCIYIYIWMYIYIYIYCLHQCWNVDKVILRLRLMEETLHYSENEKDNCLFFFHVPRAPLFNIVP